jgi:hypothetical protein
MRLKEFRAWTSYGREGPGLGRDRASDDRDPTSDDRDRARHDRDLTSDDCDPTSGDRDPTSHDLDRASHDRDPTSYAHDPASHAHDPTSYAHDPTGHVRYRASDETRFIGESPTSTSTSTKRSTYSSPRLPPKSTSWRNDSSRFPSSSFVSVSIRFGPTSSTQNDPIAAA